MMQTPDATRKDGAQEDAIPPLPAVKSFLHPIGQSTISQGLTVPKSAQSGWLLLIQKGEKVPVVIRFADGITVTASLRRLNNASGHLQFRYEGKEQAALREYLSGHFHGGADCRNGVLKVTEVEPGVFSFDLLSDGKEKPAVLSLCNPHFHNCTADTVEGLSEFKELRQALLATPYDESANQADYNKRIASALCALGWSTETRILEEIGLRCDFKKNGLWVEVEFGNARVYYQDYIKFMMAVRYRQAALGVLLCPTNAFAQLLCDLGKRRAIAKKEYAGKRRPSYSGMMSVEKALRELPFLQFMLTAGIVIAGIEITRR
jgi:hypothetical protein